MITINKLRLDITPAYFDAGGSELRIQLQVNNSAVVQSSRVLLNDDMTSIFDYIFDAAREELRHALKERGLMMSMNSGQP